jgi:hypothetical protein
VMNMAAPRGLWSAATVDRGYGGGTTWQSRFLPRPGP